MSVNKSDVAKVCAKLRSKVTQSWEVNGHCPFDIHNDPCQCKVHTYPWVSLTEILAIPSFGPNPNLRVSRDIIDTLHYAGLVRSKSTSELFYKWIE